MGCCCSRRRSHVPENILKMHPGIVLDSPFFENFSALPKDATSYRQFKWEGYTKAIVLDVYDGDTVTLGFPLKGELVTFKGRLMGIDTPEMRSKDQHEKALALKAKNILVNLVLGKEVHVLFAGNDKFGGRALVHLYTEKWQSVSQYMLNSAPCQAYDGGTKKSWSEYKE
jgi:micrococcal nuclease